MSVGFVDGFYVDGDDFSERGCWATVFRYVNGAWEVVSGDLFQNTSIPSNPLKLSVK